MKPLTLGESQPVQSLGRVLDVLGLFNGERSELSLTEIAELLEWPAPTAYRASATLLERDFLTRDPHTKRFRLGSAVIRLVAPLLADFQLPELARPHLHAIAEETGETTNLAILDGAEALYVASYPGRFRLRVEVTPGFRAPTHCTALGKCLLAQLADEEARRRLGPEPYVAPTRAAASTWSELARRLARARADGHALSVDEYEDGLLACAVPVPARDGVVAAINVAAPGSRVSPETLVETVVPKLQRAAAAIGHALPGATAAV